MMSREMERQLAEATEIAKSNLHEFVTLEHILLALTKSTKMLQILEGCGIDNEELRNELKSYIKDKIPRITQEQIDTYGGYESWTPEFTLACHRLFQRAAVQVKSSGRNQINEPGVHLLAWWW